jgi:diguanylate cyclase (GGDEF)-like protein
MLPLSVLLIDIDHFKHINDIYGHQVGDLVMSSLGKLLLQTMREPDSAARYAGEEMLDSVHAQVGRAQLSES